MDTLFGELKGTSNINTKTYKTYVHHRHCKTRKQTHCMQALHHDGTRFTRKKWRLLFLRFQRSRSIATSTSVSKKHVVPILFQGTFRKPIFYQFLCGSASGKPIFDPFLPFSTNSFCMCCFLGIFLVLFTIFIVLDHFEATLETKAITPFVGRAQRSWKHRSLQLRMMQTMTTSDTGSVTKRISGKNRPTLPELPAKLDISDKASNA